MAESTDAEIEQSRVKDPASRDALEGDLSWRSRYVAGSFGCHEALHVSVLLADLVAERLPSHGAIVQNPDWYRLASRAHEALFDVYQAIGAEHLDDPEL